MNNELPSSIAAYLEEAGFSGTEILILRRLMDGEPLTLRQLGANTGKSTGLLDQAMKKLIKKSIIRKTLVNDVPKYSLDTMDTVLEWMQEDMEQKRDMLLRRHQNFESFVTSLESGSKRPDIEYFEGEGGIKQAYIKLLNGPGEILHYLPVQWKEEEDPLRDFRVQYFRERQRRKMFSRVLAHDTTLGRRYQSRDPFEYRKTVLAPEVEYPFTFEKIITGDRIACIDHKAQTACVIRYPELADVERTLFEAIWRQVQQPRGDTGPQPLVTAVEPKKEGISLSTESFSRMREFFLSPKSLIAFGVCALLALCTTFFFYQQNLNLNKQRIQERVKSIAATAALQFDAKDIDQVWTAEDIGKPEYAKMIFIMNRIRRENEGVKYMYIMRPTEKKGTWKFVADADSIDPYIVRDFNGDGIIDSADHLSAPGEVYTETDVGDPSEFFELDIPDSYDPTNDQWGTFITGSAPIFNDIGQPVAIIGVDVDISTLQALASDSFTPILYFIGFFFLFVLVRLAAFNRSLLQELYDIVRVRNVMIMFAIAALSAVFVTVCLYFYTQQLTLRRMQDKVAAIASTAAMQIDVDDLEEFHEQSDYLKPQWSKVVNTLKQVRIGNTDIMYVYIFRKSTTSPTGLEFVADSHSLNPFANTDADTTNNVDANNDGKIDGSLNGADLLQWPGQTYPIPSDEAFESFNGLPTSNFYEDQFGNVVSGFSQLKDSEGNTVAILAVDIRADVQGRLSNQVFTPFYVFFSFFILFLLFRILHIKLSLLKTVLKFLSRRVVVLSIIFVACAGIGCWKLYLFHQRNLLIEETGKRLMAIAATAASQFNPDDLEDLRFARDMKTPEYQRVFKTLNQIREANPEIKWAYIFRTTESKNLWEFVADADSNFYLDSQYDLNSDKYFEIDDGSVWTGMKYFYDWQVYSEAIKNPSFSRQLETDQWGTFITAAAPIRKNGKTVAILGVDYEIDVPNGVKY